MNSKTKRRYRRIWNDITKSFIPLSIISTVVTIIIVPILDLFGRVLYPWTLAILWVFTFAIALYVRRKFSEPLTKYFDSIDFGERNDDVILKAVDGILNTQRVEPYYVHTAPQCNEVNDISAKLKETGFVMVLGGPGSGKSMAAYHAAFTLQIKQGYRVYRLKVEGLEREAKANFREIKDKIFDELDGLKGKRKLILVDDAHKLTIKEELSEMLQKETQEKIANLLWIETESPEIEAEEVQRDNCIRIKFANFIDVLLPDFYSSSNKLLQQVLRGRDLGLNDALERVKRGTIIDVWHFNFCVAQSWEKLAKNVSRLNDFSILVFFLISSHTVLSREQELHENELANIVRSLEQHPQFRWLSEYGPVHETLKELAKEKLIRIYDKNVSDKGYIASWHYNFAREVIRCSLSRKHLVNKLLASVKLLLTEDYHSCIGIGIFHRDIGEYATTFIDDNKDWLTRFINNFSPELSHYYALLIEDVNKISKVTYDKILSGLNTKAIAKEINLANIKRFDGLAKFLGSLGNKRKELIDALDLSQLAKVANNVQVEGFEGLAKLLGSLGEKRKELISILNFDQLAEAVNTHVEHFEGLASLLGSLGNKREKLIDALDLSQLAKVASNVQLKRFTGLARLLSSLGDKRKELINILNFAQLAEAANNIHVEQFIKLAGLLESLGEKRGKLIDALDFAQLAEAANAHIERFEELASLLGSLGNKRKELTDALDLSQLAKVASNVQAEQFNGLAGLLESLGEKRGKLIDALDFAQLAEAANAHVEHFEELASLLGSLGNKRKELIDALDLSQLAKVASNVQAEQFNGLAGLLESLGEKRGKLIDALDFAQLAEAANNVHIEQFEKMAGLLNSLGEKKKELIEKLDLGVLKSVVKQAEPWDEEDWALFLWNLTHLMAHLDESSRDEFINEMDWISFCTKCPIKNHIGTLGQCLANLIKQGKQVGIDKVVVFLQENIHLIQDEIRKAAPQEYHQIARFLWNCNQTDHSIALEIGMDVIGELITKFTVWPSNYRGIGQLINAVYSIKPDLAESFVSSNKVKGRILHSLNTHDWSEMVDGLIHLIKAFYRSAPDVWVTMVRQNWVRVELTSLNLEEIYREVDAEKDISAGAS